MKSLNDLSTKVLFDGCLPFGNVRLISSYAAFAKNPKRKY